MIVLLTATPPEIGEGSLDWVAIGAVDPITECSSEESNATAAYRPDLTCEDYNLGRGSSCASNDVGIVDATGRG